MRISIQLCQNPSPPETYLEVQLQQAKEIVPAVSWSSSIGLKVDCWPRFDPFLHERSLHSRHTPVKHCREPSSPLPVVHNEINTVLLTAPNSFLQARFFSSSFLFDHKQTTCEAGLSQRCDISIVTFTRMSGATYTTTAPVDVALPPPPGVIPDFQDPFTLRPYHNVAASLSLTFVSIFLMLRMYTKIRLVKECRLEDCKTLKPPLTTPTDD